MPWRNDHDDVGFVSPCMCLQYSTNEKGPAVNVRSKKSLSRMSPCASQQVCILQGAVNALSHADAYDSHNILSLV
jgi:hypothetical protein